MMLIKITALLILFAIQSHAIWYDIQGSVVFTDEPFRDAVVNLIDSDKNKALDIVYFEATNYGIDMGSTSWRYDIWFRLIYESKNKNRFDNIFNTVEANKNDPRIESADIEARPTNNDRPPGQDIMIKDSDRRYITK